MKQLVNKKEFRFVIVGGLSTLIDFLIYMLISNFIDLTVSKFLSMSCACIFSFFIQKSFTFSNREKITPRMTILFVLSQLINILINTSTNTLMFSLTGLKLVSFVIATGTAMVANYILQNYFVFKKEK